MIAGKLVTKGDAEIMMLYSCVTTDGEETAETMRFTLPFSQIIDIDGIDDTFTADVRITLRGVISYQSLTIPAHLNVSLCFL